ncbi:MAG: hypothetical protein ABH858_04190 [Candidatus Omnitrophota bacterium]
MDTSGNVGIGTTASPDERLHIEKNGHVYLKIHATSSQNTGIKFQSGGWDSENSGRDWELVEDSGVLKFNSYASPAADYSNVLVLDEDGDVGIGTANPVYTLDVIGDIRATGSVYYGGTAGNINGAAYPKPDYVFHENYAPMSIEEVEQYLKKQKHLPWLTSVKKETEENGNIINMTRMSFETLEALENLQIQIIELNNIVKQQSTLIEKQQKIIASLIK